jgi:uncharacterized protein (TIGR00730 family)
MKLVKAYNNTEFLNSPQARLIRILAEMLEPAARFRKYNVRDTVVIFGSAKILPMRITGPIFKKIEARINRMKSPPASLIKVYEQARCNVKMSQYYEDAANLSERLTRYFQTLKKKGKNFMICSGGGPGIMEAANYGAGKAGGKSIGLNISLPVQQPPNLHQSEELAFEFHYFFIRKFWFFYLAKALVVFPGGYGTMDELFELLTLVQTGKSRKQMPIILYGSDYWRQVINFENMVHWGTIDKEDLKLFKIVDDVEEAFEYLKNFIERFNLRNKLKK